MAENKNIEVGSRLHSIATGNVIAGANEIFDDDKNKKQSQINTETYSLVEEINAKLNTLSPDQQAALDVAGKANNNEAKLGYYVCDTEGNVAAKVIPNITGYVLSVGGSMKVKMTNANTANNTTLNINSTGAKPLYYDGKRASATNSWKAGETVEVYYDGTSYYANSVASSMVTSEKIATSAFDDTLSVSGKIAPADAVGTKLTDLSFELDDVKSGLLSFSKNRFDISHANDNKIIQANGSLSDNQYHHLSNKIMIREGESLHISAEYNNFSSCVVCQYDVRGEALSDTRVEPTVKKEGDVYSFDVVGANKADYLLFSTSSPMRDAHHIQAELGDKRTSYEQYEVKNRIESLEEIIKTSNPIGTKEELHGFIFEMEVPLTNSPVYILNKKFFNSKNVGSTVILEIIENEVEASMLQVSYNELQDLSGENRYVQLSAGLIVGSYLISSPEDRPYISSILFPANSIKKGGRIRGILRYGIGKTISEMSKYNYMPTESDNTGYYELLNTLENKQIEDPSMYVGKGYSTINVENQSDFDGLQSAITTKIQQGVKKVAVAIREGTYYFSEDHLSFMSDNADVDIHIYGVGNVVITAKGDDYNVNEATAFVNGYYKLPYTGIFSKDAMYIADGKAVRLFDWEGLKFAKSEVTPSSESWVEGNKGYCKIKTGDNPVSEAEAENLYINITSWYLADVYKVVKIENGYVYFLCDNMEKMASHWKVNADFGFTSGRLFPRYRLVNSSENDIYVFGGEIYIKTKYNRVHECQTARFAKFNHASIKSFIVENLTFFGNSAKSITNETPIKDLPMFSVNETNFEQFCIKECTFESLNSRAVIDSFNGKNIALVGCSFKNNLQCIAIVRRNSDNFIFAHNIVENNGCAYTNSDVARCEGKNSHIHNNVIKNYSYTGFSVGRHYSLPNTDGASSIIEYNVLMNTDEFVAKSYCYGLMDGGGIYTSTAHDSCIIRHNVLINTTGMSSMRGIFCDDGAKNVNTYGNLIIGTHNSYDFDLRYSNREEMVSKIPDHNTNNVFISNIITGKYRFEGVGSEDGCVRGQNILLRDYEKGDIVSVSNKENDFNISKYNIVGHKVSLPYIVLVRLDDLRISEFVRGYIDIDSTITYT